MKFAITLLLSLAFGAEVMAELAVEGIREQKLGLAKFLKKTAAK
jgi:hypothetical protein